MMVTAHVNKCITYIFLFIYFFLNDVSLDQVELRDSGTFDDGFRTKKHQKRHRNLNKISTPKTFSEVTCACTAIGDI